ncbi:MAG: hypothetical protein NT138_16710 [Planctomycetales bacterium]|nr:hypothetical protein [Planctomycetales bacterium]
MEVTLHISEKSPKGKMWSACSSPGYFPTRVVLAGESSSNNYSSHQVSPGGVASSGNGVPQNRSCKPRGRIAPFCKTCSLEI